MSENQERGFSYLKDKAILIGWITGLLLLISILWVLTAQFQANNLLRTVNSVLISNEDPRRLSEYNHQKTAKADVLGYWYSLNNSNDKMFVFGVFQDGITIPLGAVVSPDGIVKEVMPLSAHAVQVFDNLPKSILQMYIKRIEGDSR